MSTYECNNCFGTFDGLGIRGPFGYGWRYCPQCAVLKQQEEQHRINEEHRRKQEYNNYGSNEYGDSDWGILFDPNRRRRWW